MQNYGYSIVMDTTKQQSTKSLFKFFKFLCSCFAFLLRKEIRTACSGAEFDNGQNVCNGKLENIWGRRIIVPSAGSVE